MVTLQDIDQLLCIKGMVTRCSAIIPNLNQAFFRCFVCAHSLDVVVDRYCVQHYYRCFVLCTVCKYRCCCVATLTLSAKPSPLAFVLSIWTMGVTLVSLVCLC